MGDDDDDKDKGKKDKKKRDKKKKKKDSETDDENETTKNGFCTRTTFNKRKDKPDMDKKIKELLDSGVACNKTEARIRLYRKNHVESDSSSDEADNQLLLKQ